MAEKPGDRAKEHLKEGLGHMWRAAREAARYVQREAGDRKRDAGRSTVGSVTRTIDDAGREVARAANNVADRIGEELARVEASARQAFEGRPKDIPRDPWPEADGLRGDAADVPGPTGAEEWPKTQEEYELRYGPAAAPPASPESPRRDSGLRIATDDDDDGDR